MIITYKMGVTGVPTRFCLHLMFENVLLGAYRTLSKLWGGCLHPPRPRKSGHEPITSPSTCATALRNGSQNSGTSEAVTRSGSQGWRNRKNCSKRKPCQYERSWGCGGMKMIPVSLSWGHLGQFPLPLCTEMSVHESCFFFGETDHHFSHPGGFQLLPTISLHDREEGVSSL